MTTATDEELLKMGQEDLRDILENWGAIDLTFQDTDSYWGDKGKACIAIIKPRYHKNIELQMRLELIDQKPSGRCAYIQYGEDNWEEIDAEHVWAWCFFYTLDKVKA